MIGSRYCHFEIERLLGTGGMGEVYLAVDMNLERRVALKFLPKSLTGDRTAQGRLLDEARSCARLTHPNIVGIHSVEEDGGVFAICMEYVEGKTVREILSQRRIEIQRIVEIALGVARGLAAAHEHGIIHRDLKPANVVITGKGQVKVMDFGLALRPRRTVETTGPESYGTVSYMSPEQARGMTLTPATDIFSFGSLLYKMLTHRLPFEGENDLATLHAIISAEPASLREQRREVPPGLERLITACLAKKAEDRPSSMEEIVSILQRLAGPTKSAPRDLISELTTGLETESLRRRHSRKVRPISKRSDPVSGPSRGRSEEPSREHSFGATADSMKEWKPEMRFPRKIGSGKVAGSGPVTPRSDPGPRSIEPASRGTTPGRESGVFHRPVSRPAEPVSEASGTPVWEDEPGAGATPTPLDLDFVELPQGQAHGNPLEESSSIDLPPARVGHRWKTLLGAVLALIIAAGIVVVLVQFVLRPRTTSGSAELPVSPTSAVHSSVMLPMRNVVATRQILTDATEPLPEMIDLPLPPAPPARG